MSVRRGIGLYRLVRAFRGGGGGGGGVKFAPHATKILKSVDNFRHFVSQVMPDKSLDTLFFWNSGSEAVEAAVKLARHATGVRVSVCVCRCLCVCLFVFLSLCLSLCAYVCSCVCVFVRVWVCVLVCALLVSGCYSARNRAHLLLTFLLHVTSTYTHTHPHTRMLRTQASRTSLCHTGATTGARTGQWP